MKLVPIPRQYLIRTAKFVNLLTPKDKAKYVDECWDLLQEAYAYAGGFKSAPTREALIADSFLWKLNTRGGKVVALRIYKQSYGRKAIASATDGSSMGKSAIKEIYREDLTRAWAEVSGAVEATLLRLGGEKYKVPAKYAEELLGKQVTLDEDGFHYTRVIAGKPMRKMIIGTPQGMDIDRNP